MAAANPHTATYLLASLKRRGMLPSSSDTLADSDFLEFGTEELRTYVMDLLVNSNEEYAVKRHAVTVTANTAEYFVPPRATAGALRSVELLVDDEYVPLDRIEPDRANLYGSSTGEPTAYYLEGNYVVMVPTPSASGTARFKYYQRPNRLVATSEAGQVQSINTGTNTVTLTDSAPVAFTTSERFDFIKGTSGFDSLGIDHVATNVSGVDITFSSLPTGLAVGDFVALAEQSPIPQVPVELHPLLSQRIVVRALEALGDKAGAQAADKTCEGMKDVARSLLAPRVSGSPRKIIHYNGPGWGRRRRLVR